TQHCPQEQPDCLTCKEGFCEPDHDDFDHNNGDNGDNGDSGNNGDNHQPPTCNTNQDCTQHCPQEQPDCLTCKEGFCEPDHDDGQHGENNQHGPMTCQAESECVDKCPPEAVGCTCADVPDGQKLCIPICSTDDDCVLGIESLTCNQAKGVCEPATEPPAP
ncbi:MAG: hypothetical protein VX699_00525, partial [Myxococcota bacterium]|nr:hypothetical protein [Myxococcota bacterium]